MRQLLEAFDYVRMLPRNVVAFGQIPFKVIEAGLVAERKMPFQHLRAVGVQDRRHLWRFGLFEE